MTAFDDGVFLTELVAAVAAVGTPPLRVFSRKIPTGTAAPALPYAIAHPAGGEWDRALLQREFTAGWYTVQWTSVGKGAANDDLSMAAAIRAALASNLSGTGWAITDAESEGPPLPVDSTGTLQAVAERIRIYVQAV